MNEDDERIVGLSDSDEQRRLDELQKTPLSGGTNLARMIASLSDGSWRVRKEAVSRLSRWEEPETARRELLSLIDRAEDAVARNAALEAMVLMGSAAVEALCKAYDSGHSRRKLFLDALGEIGDPAASATLIRALMDQDENTRMGAAESLGKVGGEGAVEALTGRLGAEGLLVTAAVMEALWRLGSFVDHRLILPMVGDRQLKRLSVRLLGLSGQPEAIDPVTEALADPTPSIREAAVEAAVTLHALVKASARDRLELKVAEMSSAARARLVLGLKSANPSVRGAAAKVLSWTRDPEVLEPLCRALSDEQSGEAAGDALCAMSPLLIPRLQSLASILDPLERRALYALTVRLPGVTFANTGSLESQLIEDLESPDDDLALSAANALSVAGGARAVTPLVRTLQPDRDPTMVKAAAAALGILGVRHRAQVTEAVLSLGEGMPAFALGALVLRMGGAEYLPLIERALDSEDVEVRVSAVRALGGLSHRSEAFDLAISVRSDPEPLVRASVAAFLGGASSKQAVPPLIEALDDVDAEVRVAAAKALGRIGAENACKKLVDLLGRDKSAAVVVQALEVLRSLEYEIPPAALEAGLDHPDAEVMKAALKAAGERYVTRKEFDLSKVRQKLLHPRWDVRLEAVRAMARSPNKKDVVSGLDELLTKETDSLVRQVASEILQRIGNKEAD